MLNLLKLYRIFYEMDQKKGKNKMKDFNVWGWWKPILRHETGFWQVFFLLLILCDVSKSSPPSCFCWWKPANHNKVGLKGAGKGGEIIFLSIMNHTSFLPIATLHDLKGTRELRQRSKYISHNAIQKHLMQQHRNPKFKKKTLLQRHIRILWSAVIMTLKLLIRCKISVCKNSKRSANVITVACFSH